MGMFDFFKNLPGGSQPEQPHKSKVTVHPPRLQVQLENRPAVTPPSPAPHAPAPTTDLTEDQPAAAPVPAAADPARQQKSMDAIPVFTSNVYDNPAHFSQLEEHIYPLLQTEHVPKTVLLRTGEEEMQVALPYIPHLAGLNIYFTVELESKFQIMHEQMLPPYIKPDDLLMTARENLAQKISFKIVPGKFGGYGVVASDTSHVASCILLPDLWAAWAGQVGDNLAIAVPGRETVLLGAASNVATLSRMKSLSETILMSSPHPLTMRWLYYDRKERRFFRYIDHLARK